VNRASIRSHLLLLVLAVSIPLVVVVGYGTYHDLQRAVAHSKTSLRTLASMMVSNTGGRIAGARRTLEILAERPLVKRVDPGRCDPALKDLHALNPGFSNVVYTDLAGATICSALPLPDGKPVNVGQTPWFRKFLQEKRFTVGQPHYGPITGKWVSVLSAPIRNERGELVGAIHMPLDLKDYDPNIPAQNLPPESRYGFFADDGIMIWRNLDPEGVIGTRPNAEAARRIVEVRDGEFESLAIDGVTRFFSVVPMPDTGWVAFIGVPAASVHAEARRHAIALAAIALGAIALIGALALAIARRIAGPVAELEKTARAVHEGNLGVRAPVAGPSEIAEVAREFNAMIEAQQRSHAQLRAFLDNSAVIAWLKDDRGRFIFVSDNFLARFALRREAVIGRTDHDVWPKEHADEFRRNDEEILAGNASQEVVEAARNPDGSVSWWLASKFAYTDAGGHRVVGGLAVDITRNKQAETALRESEERFRDLTELSSDWFWEQDSAFRFTLVSGSDADKGGYRNTEITGKCRWELPIEGVSEAEWAQHRATLERHEPFRDFVYSVRKPDGTLGWNSINGRPVFNPDGSFRGYRGTGNDITERKLAEASVRHLNETLELRVLERTASLEVSNRELEAFSYSVSHDLRAPLRALDGFSYLLKEEYADRLDEAGQEYLSRIRDASQRMGTLIDDLIELARISRLEMKRVELDLTILAQEVAASLREQAPQRKVTWVMAPDLRANADPVLAKALIDNLVRNAWKFTAERTAARIEVGCTHKDGETVFFVRDDGAGFDQTYADKLFKPFQRLHDAKRFPGTGIGLATVMRVVRRHGGRVWAEGSPDRGAVFYFTLP